MSIKERIERKVEDPIFATTIVLGLVTILFLILDYPYLIKENNTFYKEILIEAHGIIFEIGVIGILIYWLNMQGNKRQRIRESLEEIEDFREWQSEEAAYRIAGNLRRLNKNNIHSFKLNGSYLVKTNMSDLKLYDSNLNYARLDNCNMSRSEMTKCRFNQASMSGVNGTNADFRGSMFTGTNMENINLVSANMINASLVKANMEGAFLVKTNLQGADFAGTNLKGANLYKTDLRNAKDLTPEQLLEARTFYKALLDQELRESVNNTPVSSDTNS